MESVDIFSEFVVGNFDIVFYISACNPAATYFLQINNSSNWRWRSEADFVEEFVDDSNAFLYFRYLTRV